MPGLTEVSDAITALESGDPGPALRVLRKIIDEMADARCEP